MRGDKLRKPDFFAKFVQITTLKEIRVLLGFLVMYLLFNASQASLESSRVRGTLCFTWFVVSQIPEASRKSLFVDLGEELAYLVNPLHSFLVKEV